MNSTQLTQDTLMEIGVKPSLKGYDHLVYAIHNYYSYDGKLEALYNKIAALYNTTRGAVERTIRHAIQNCFRRTLRGDIWSKIFSNTIDCDKLYPTNKEFIACVARYIERKEVK